MSVGRILVGVSLLVRPDLVTNGWIGRRAAGKPAARVLSRALGIRDLAIGMGALRALRGGGNARAWLVAGLAADATDVAVTYAERDSLPAGAVPIVGGLGGSGAAIGAYGLLGLDEAGGTPGPLPA